MHIHTYERATLLFFGYTELTAEPSYLQVLTDQLSSAHMQISPPVEVEALLKG